MAILHARKFCQVVLKFLGTWTWSWSVPNFSPIRECEEIGYLGGHLGFYSGMMGHFERSKKLSDWAGKFTVCWYGHEHHFCQVAVQSELVTKPAILAPTWIRFLTGGHFACRICCQIRLKLSGIEIETWTLTRKVPNLWNRVFRPPSLSSTARFFSRRNSLFLLQCHFFSYYSIYLNIYILKASPIPWYYGFVAAVWISRRQIGQQELVFSHSSMQGLW